MFKWFSPHCELLLKGGAKDKGARVLTPDKITPWEKKPPEHKEPPVKRVFRPVATHVLQGRRKVWKSGGLVVMGGENVLPLVEIGLSDLPKTGGVEHLQPPCSRQPCVLLDSLI